MNLVERACAWLERRLRAVWEACGEVGSVEPCPPHDWERVLGDLHCKKCGYNRPLTENVRYSRPNWR